MRLDLFLKASRLVIRRAVAQQLCDANRVEVNGVAAKSSRAIKAGDEITLRRVDRLIKARVLAVPTAKQTARADAPDLYELLQDTPIKDDWA
jgi:ribosomal 50S subunit-recycling heat shock protein